MKNHFTRRNILIGAGGAVAAMGALYEARSLLRVHYKPTPYDDLLALLDDRAAGVQVGNAVLVEIGAFDPGLAAADLRARLKDTTLAGAIVDDMAAGRLLEANGWVLPETLALLCAVAAQVA
jgi:hypothetical protein